MKILIAGDYCDRYRVTTAISNEDFSSLFHEIKPVVESCDYSVLNFEFPIVVKDGTPIPKCGPNLKGQKKAIDAIQYAGFNVCTLANNHILDQGEKCCLETKKILEESSIKTVGVGANPQEASEILYLEKETRRLAVINCCEHEFSIVKESAAGANPLNPVSQYYKIKEAKEKADFVIVVIHGGQEYYQLPSPRMQETYRFFIDAGADVVVNHHQHCFSGYELYRNKPIFYGLGNLLFDDPHKRNSIWNEGFMLELTLEKDKEIAFKMIPYTQCNKTPSINLLTPNEHSVFNKKINKLNSIISSPESLRKHYEQMMEETNKEYELLFQPVRSRITDALFRRGLLPSFLKKSRRLLFYNYVACESHVGRLLHALSKYS